MSKTTKNLISPKNLPYLGAAVQAALFSLAGQKFFQSFGWLAGLGVGAVVNYSIALASSRINDISEKRKPLARIALVVMLLLSPATITLSFFAPSSIFTAITWAACVDLSIVLAGAIAGKSLIETEQPQKSAERKPAKKKIRSAKIQCRYAGCERDFATQNAANAHARNCPMRPTISMPAPIENDARKRNE